MGRIRGQLQEHIEYEINIYEMPMELIDNDIEDMKFKERNITI
jgi:hypothetical protein